MGQGLAAIGCRALKSRPNGAGQDSPGGGGTGQGLVGFGKSGTSGQGLGGDLEAATADPGGSIRGSGGRIPAWTVGSLGC